MEGKYEYYPVSIGDILGEGHYRIVHKLTHRPTAVTWLARDCESETLVALKIRSQPLDASWDNVQEPEIVAPASLVKSRQHNKGPSAILRLQAPERYFTVTTPYTQHLCLVYNMKSTGPSVEEVISLTGRPLEPGLARGVAKQVAESMAMMHGEGWIHGSMCTANISFCLNPRFQEWPDEVVYAYFGKPRKERRAKRFRLGPLGTSDKASFLQVLNDHSTATTPSLLIPYLRPAPPSHAPPSHAPPESQFGERAGFPSDVWALACTLFEIRTGQRLFPERSEEDADRTMKNSRIPLGARGRWPLPEPWKAEFVMRVEAVTKEDRGPFVFHVEGISLDAELMSAGVQDREERRLMLELLKRMLQYSPEDRIRIDEVVAHPWFTYVDC
ncbi:kinase-like domain-containing protein [Ephemerocybe angulata]|uniref:Kinase-like domain-containing protein n=1 Tax=Ephemerocybe angulata TaxID=980116 RepID=A0A8H6M2S7_9AGAR|nr:kinase-like domain-containing protein [Tulosesus angulatus]